VLAKRIIACLDVDAGRVVKGVRFQDLRDVDLAGVIVGKALYEGRFTVAEGQAALDGA
jgi:imidazole glycerol phosphate synthase subunit HisF